MFLTDLTFVEEGNPTFFENGKINFKKCSKIYSTIESMLKGQSIPYDIEPDPLFQKFFNNLPEITQPDALDEAWFEKSREIEPPSETQQVKKFEIEFPKKAPAMAELVLKLLDHSVIKTVAIKEHLSSEKAIRNAFSILEIEKIVNEMKKEIFTCKKRYNMRSYKDTFMAHDGFLWIKEYFAYSNDNDVLDFGTMLLEEGFIASVPSGIKTFKNEEMAFRFVDNHEEGFLEKKGSVLVKKFRNTTM